MKIYLLPTYLHVWNGWEEQTQVPIHTQTRQRRQDVRDSLQHQCPTHFHGRTNVKNAQCIQGAKTVRYPALPTRSVSQIQDEGRYVNKSRRYLDVASKQPSFLASDIIEVFYER